MFRIYGITAPHHLLLEILAAQSQAAKSNIAADALKACFSPLMSKPPVEYVPEEGAPAPEHKLEVIQLVNDGEADIRFEGRHLQSVSAVPRNGRTQTFTLYLTKGGRYVAVKTGHSVWPNERPRQEVKVIEKTQDIPAFLGYSPLAKELYKRLDLDLVNVVE